MGPEILALGNLVVQFILISLVGYAGYVAKSQKALGKHCNLMRIAVLLLMATVAVVMIPSLVGYSKPGIPISWLYVELWIHHSLGLVVLVIFIYANLADLGIVMTRRGLLLPMRIAAIAWLGCFLLGVHLYLVIWT